MRRPWATSWPEMELIAMPKSGSIWECPMLLANFVDRAWIPHIGCGKCSCHTPGRKKGSTSTSWSWWLSSTCSGVKLEIQSFTASRCWPWWIIRWHWAASLRDAVPPEHSKDLFGGSAPLASPLTFDYVWPGWRVSGIPLMGPRGGPKRNDPMPKQQVLGRRGQFERKKERQALGCLKIWLLLRQLEKGILRRFHVFFCFWSVTCTVTPLVFLCLIQGSQNSLNPCGTMEIPNLMLVIACRGCGILSHNVNAA